MHFLSFKQNEQAPKHPDII